MMKNNFEKDAKKLHNKVAGNIGEAKAFAYLESKGYKILETNYKVHLGEIDIIAKDKNCLVFVEVKQRSTAKFGLPIEAVTPQKQQKIKKVAEFYLMMKHLYDCDVRFDVIEILGDEITHHKNAFM